jgi:hypothetical protein
MTAMSAAQYTFITLVGTALALAANSAPAQSPPVFHVRRQRESHINGSVNEIAMFSSPGGGAGAPRRVSSGIMTTSLTG